MKVLPFHSIFIILYQINLNLDLRAGSVCFFTTVVMYISFYVLYVVVCLMAWGNASHGTLSSVRTPSVRTSSNKVFKTKCVLVLRTH